MVGLIFHNKIKSENPKKSFFTVILVDLEGVGIKHASPHERAQLVGCKSVGKAKHSSSPFCFWNSKFDSTWQNERQKIRMNPQLPRVHQQRHWESQAGQQRKSCVENCEHEEDVSEWGFHVQVWRLEDWSCDQISWQDELLYFFLLNLVLTMIRTLCKTLFFRSINFSFNV